MGLGGGVVGDEEFGGGGIWEVGAGDEELAGSGSPPDGKYLPFVGQVHLFYELVRISQVSDVDVAAILAIGGIEQPIGRSCYSANILVFLSDNP